MEGKGTLRQKQLSRRPLAEMQFLTAAFPCSTFYHYLCYAKKISMKRIMQFGLLLSLASLLASCATKNAASNASDIALPGQQLPSFSAPMSDGTTLSPASMAGKVAVVVFFNTSCYDCRKELPDMQRLYETCPPEQVAIACISREESDADIRAYWKEQGLTLPYSAQTGREAYSLFARVSIPRVYVADRDGIIRYSFKGRQASYKKLRKSINALLARQPNH